MAARPKRLRVDPEAPDPGVMAEAAIELRRGGVVAYPTETFYGLAASAFDARGCRRVFEIKGRPASRALPCILSGREQMELVASAVSPLVFRLAEIFWPGPLTLVVPAKHSLAAASDDRTVAVRVSSHRVARGLAAAAGPVSSTSANRAGQREATTADEVESALGKDLNIILDGGATTGGLSSTIVDVTGGVPKLVREGRVPFRDVLEAFGESEKPRNLDFE